MKWTITYLDTRTQEQYSLGGVEADNYNEAAKLAKIYRGEYDIIEEITLEAASVFDGILDSGLFGRAAR